MSTSQPTEATATNIAHITKRIRHLGRLPWVKSGVSNGLTLRPELT